MGASTAYGILTHQDSRTRIDYELETRFYKPRDLSEIPVHKLNFLVWRQSMQVRFFLEMIVFFANVSREAVDWDGNHCISRRDTERIA